MLKCMHCQKQAVCIQEMSTCMLSGVWFSDALYSVAPSPAPLLTLENVLKAVEKAKNWGDLSDELVGHGPRRNIQYRHNSDEDCLKAAVENFILGKGHYELSWRRVIFALDGANEIHLADQIRDYAEPVQGEKRVHVRVQS